MPKQDPELLLMGKVLRVAAEVDDLDAVARERVRAYLRERIFPTTQDAAPAPVPE